MPKTVLVTGGAGFIGSNFIKLLLENEDFRVVNIDALTYAGNLKNLTDIESHINYSFRKLDIRILSDLNSLFDEIKFDFILNFAAESHVDRSIHDPTPFASTNILGTLNLLELARKHNVKRFLQVSTDEVYGSLGISGKFNESNNLLPNSPYSASKASADLIVRSFVKTYGLDAVITRCSNNYGPYQFPEKLIPLVILNAINNRKIPVYSDGKNVRDWIHVKDHCEAILTVLLYGESGEIYNIGADSEKQNIEIVRLILNIIGKSDDLIDFVKDRPGHDKRYAIDNSKILTNLKWYPKINFEDGIRQTIDWYLNNQNWCNEILNGDYMNYYEKQYHGK